MKIKDVRRHAFSPLWISLLRARVYLDGNKDQFHQNKEVTALNETTKRLLAVATRYVLVYLEPPQVCGGANTWSAAPVARRVPRTRDETIIK